MNKHIACVSLGLALAMVTATGYTKDPDAHPGSATSTSNTFTLDSKTLEELKQKAIHGDSVASNQVALHYNYGVNNHDAGFTWLYMAASQNNPWAQISMATRNASDGPYKNISLAKFWLREAAKHEEARKEAEEQLRILEEREGRNPRRSD